MNFMEEGLTRLMLSEPLVNTVICLHISSCMDEQSQKGEIQLYKQLVQVK